MMQYVLKKKKKNTKQATITCVVRLLQLGRVRHMLKNFFDQLVPLTVIFGVLIGYFAIVAAFWGGFF